MSLRLFRDDKFPLWVAASTRVLGWLALTGSALVIACGDDEPFIRPVESPGAGEAGEGGPDAGESGGAGGSGGRGTGGAGTGGGSDTGGSAAFGGTGAQGGTGGGGALAEHVVLISVDGLGSYYLEGLLAAGRVPAFAAVQARGACTFNARTDPGNTTTIPNHTAMLTGLFAVPDATIPPTSAHGYLGNGTPFPEDTLHNRGNPALPYIPSMFDVAHDHGLGTAMYASKTKFSLFTQSYNDAGASDAVLPDNGPRKIDTAMFNAVTAALTDAVVTQLVVAPPALTFLHWADPDTIGHGSGWGSEAFMEAVVAMDRELDKLLRVFEVNQLIQGKTALIVTADHGGEAFGHSDITNELSYTIPFCVMGNGIPAGTELYELVPERKAPPKTKNPPASAAEQPIRNGDAGNVALRLLGLPPIAGSVLRGWEWR